MTRRTLGLACLLAALIIPFDALADGTVTVPLDRFEQLLEAGRATPSPPRGALYGVVSHRVSAVEQGPRLLVSIRLDVDVYEPGTVVPLVPSGALAVAGCTVGGRPAPLVELDGAVGTRIPDRGVAEIEIQMVAGGRVAAGGSVRVPLLPRAITTLQVRRDRDDLRLAIDPAVPLREEEGLLVGVLPPSDALTLRWEKRLDDDSPASQRVEASLQHTVEVRESGIQGRAALEVVVEGKPLAELTLRVPEGLAGARVQGAAVRATHQTGRDVRVQFAYPVTGRQQLEMRYDLGDAKATQFLVPDIEVGVARRLSGSLVIVADPEVEVVQEGAARGYQPADVSDLAEGHSIPSGTVVFVYSFYEQPVEAAFAVRRHERVPVLASAGERVRARTVVTSDGKAVTTYALRVTNNDRQFLRLTLPPGADTWSAFVAGQAVRPAMDDAGRLVVPVPKSRRVAGQAEPYLVEMTWMWDVASPEGVYGGELYELPRIDIVTTDIQWEVYVPDRYRYFDFEGTVLPARDTVAPLTFDDEDEGDAPVGRQGGPPERLPSKYTLDMDKDLSEQRDKNQVDNGFLPVRLGVPATGQRLAFRRPLAGASEPLTMSMRYYDTAYIVAAQWVALLGLFVLLLAIYAHLLLAIRNLGFVRGPRWFAAGATGLFVFAILQGLLPIAFPPWWGIILLAMGAGLLYGTSVFWAAIVGLSRSLWARFGGSVMHHARSVMPASDVEVDDE
jgi:hypothetical protein